MITRYSRKEMASIWTEENKFASWLKVELAAMEAMAECGIIPREVPKRAFGKAACDVEQILAIEEKTHHDVAAFVDQVAACMGEDGRYFHYGLTSSDVLLTDGVPNLYVSSSSQIDQFIIATGKDHTGEINPCLLIS